MLHLRKYAANHVNISAHRGNYNNVTVSSVWPACEQRT